MTTETPGYWVVYDLTVDPVLEAYLPGPPATTDEQLRASLIAAGRAIDPVKVWGNKIVDGHRRYKFCKALGLPYRKELMDFTDIDHAKFFMDQWYHAQRHLDARDSKLSLARMVEFERKQREKSKAAGERPSGDTPIKKVAKAAGVTTRTVDRALQYAKDQQRQSYAAIVPELRELIECRELRLAIEDVVQLGTLPSEQQMGVYGEFSKTRDRTIANVLRGLEEDTPVATDLTDEEIADLAKPPKQKKQATKEDGVVDVPEAEDSEIDESAWEDDSETSAAAEPEKNDIVSCVSGPDLKAPPDSKRPPTKPAMDLVDNAYRNLGLMMKAIDDLQDLIPSGFRYGAATDAKNKLSSLLKEWQADAQAGKGGE